jgi:hypothetical protein
MVIWPAATKDGYVNTKIYSFVTFFSLSAMILLACQCARALLDELHDYSVPGTGCTLKLHIGIGAGPVSGVYIGGANNQTEFFISGQVLEQVSSCEKQAAPGEAFVSAIAWMLLKKGSLIGQQKGTGVLSNYRLEGIKNPLELPQPVQFPLSKDMAESLRMYISPAAMRHIESDTKNSLAELRNVSVIFVNLNFQFVENKISELQDCIYDMQSIVFKYEGVVRQFIIDDKVIEY